MTLDVMTVTGQLVLADTGSDAVTGSVVATVKVVDIHGDVLGATAVWSDSLPVRWQIAIDPAIAAATESMSVWAALRTEDNQWWGTLDLIPAGADEIVLNQVPD